jgi:hypothetical protein
MGSAAGPRNKEDSGIQNQELRKQVESTQEELFKMETQRDEIQVKVELQDKQLEEAITREADLQVLVQLQI